jgi:hypothetical protein
LQVVPYHHGVVFGGGVLAGSGVGRIWKDIALLMYATVAVGVSRKSVSGAVFFEGTRGAVDFGQGIFRASSWFSLQDIPLWGYAGCWVP